MLLLRLLACVSVLALAGCSGGDVTATLADEAAEVAVNEATGESCPNLFLLGKATTSAKQVEVSGVSCDEAVAVIKGVETLEEADSITPYSADGFDCTARYGSRQAVQFWDCSSGDRRISFTTQ